MRLRDRVNSSVFRERCGLEEDVETKIEKGTYVDVVWAHGPDE